MDRPIARCCGLAAPIALAAIVALLVPMTVGAANYPDRPIKLIVPFGPGGPPDVAARIIAEYLSSHLGPVVVENHVGAGGTLGARAVASAPPDGYTLLAATAGSLAISPYLYGNAGIDPIKDFTAVALVSSAPLVLAVHKSVPAHSVTELVTYAKANPGKLNYGAVIGTPPQLCGEMFKVLTGTNIVFVPYKSATQATIDVLTGQMAMTFEGTTGIIPYIRSGQLRPLAVTSAARVAEIPDVPTMNEAGYSGMPPDSWQAIVAPAGTPPDIVAKINAVVNEGLATPEVRNKIERLGGEPQPRSPQDFAAFIASQTQRWSKVIRRTGVTLQ
ncbi:MAG TPA: tripartite tricarboxylate transporter substrate binding protein [Xanthobacteraceae bacterium]|jgi:tripartite-type tricarboxylate transporter receptor subunit TctC